jgi:transcriptional regulator with XRE-family HTH domain
MMATPDRWTKFGRWVEQERSARRLSKAEACKLAGVSPSSWYNIEHGGRLKDGKRIAHQPSTETLFGIAKAFEMDPADVFKAAGLSPPGLAPSRPQRPLEEPQAAAPVASAAPFPPPGTTDPGVLSLLAQLLAEQRELRASLQALREEIANLRAPSRR